MRGGMRARVKICGITRAQDAEAACAAGADAIGFNFYRPSPRFVPVDAAAAIRRSLPPFVTAVGLFVNAGGDEVARIADAVGLDLLQFHGDEPAGDCERTGMPYMKAVRVGADTDLRAIAGRYGSAAALLLDTPDEKLWGGTGQTFDWELVPRELGKPMVLAGGLTPANVADAVRRIRPWAVDVSGGVESAPGIKDAAKMRAFIEEVDRVTIAERAG